MSNLAPSVLLMHLAEQRRCVSYSNFVAGVMPRNSGQED